MSGASGSSGASLLRTPEAAALAGMQPASWRRAVSRDPVLQAARVMLDGRTPAWPREVVETWLAGRPGQGSRTDLHS